jgi:hypothetical protein
MHFLDASGRRLGNIQMHVGVRADRPAIAAGQRDCDEPVRPGRVERQLDVARSAARGDPERDIPSPPEPGDLPRKHLLVAVVVGNRRDDAGVGRQGHRGKRAAFTFEASDKFGDEMLCIRGAAAVAERQHLATIRQRARDGIGCRDD